MEFPIPTHPPGGSLTSLLVNNIKLEKGLIIIKAAFISNYFKFLYVKIRVVPDTDLAG